MASVGAAADAVLRGPFDRVLTFAKAMGKSLTAEHLSVNMERSQENHVHIQVYHDLVKTFHREGVGSVFASADCDPFAYDAVEGRRLDSLRSADASAAQRCWKERAAVRAAKVEADALEEHAMSMKDFPEVDDSSWPVPRGPRHRRAVLATVGGASLGRSMLAARVLRKLGDILGLGRTLIWTWLSSPFDWTRDAGAILAGVGDALILNQNLAMFHTGYWLSNRQNATALNLSEKDFVGAPAAPRAAAPAPQASPQSRCAAAPG
ncbi:unnamed protein product [Prorocentrum cordatum]|uniref:Uncharacterized protein n=1 Tax=Prorocentrum cordatum TaxID=2364126 RepID=A0ABN9PUV1_9DINO|nr:unnamed protein product [Polarella glacialis]